MTVVLAKFCSVSYQLLAYEEQKENAALKSRLDQIFSWEVFCMCIESILKMTRCIKHGHDLCSLSYYRKFSIYLFSTISMIWVVRVDSIPSGHGIQQITQSFTNCVHVLYVVLRYTRSTFAMLSIGIQKISQESIWVEP